VRLLTGLALFLFLLPALAFLDYWKFSEGLYFVGPYSLQPSNSTSLHYIDFFFPSRALVEITCTHGSGRVYVVDALGSRTVFNASFEGTLSTGFVLPHEGNYIVFYEGRGETQCLLRFERPYPTVQVQNAYIMVGVAGAIAFIRGFRR